MKSENGITLVSLTIYIIGLLSVIVIITVVTSFFYTTVDLSTDNVDTLIEYTKFTSFFSEDINLDSLKFVNCQVENNVVGGIEKSFAIFNNGHQYTFVKENEAIYLQNAKIASGVESCEFISDIDSQTGKEKIIVKIKFIGNDNIKETSYIIN